jgi:7,8-dihydropterin-6-yl-methyl-4-(beta-D-ribofuranosyl)aminobenzene 5'-phosphate synthase
MDELKSVDGVEILTIIDNYIDVFLPGSEEVIRPSLWTQGELNKPLMAEHGLCLLVTIYDGQERHTIMVDAGFSTGGCLYNLDTMGVSLDKVEALVLSHGHFDHVGSLQKLFENGCIKKGTPLYLHPTAFAERGLKASSGEKIGFPQLSKQSLLECGADLIIRNEPTLIANDCCLLTGEVPRRSFEIGFPIGWRSEDGNVVQDNIPDDQSLIFHVKGKGLVVVLGCGHSGVINILNHAKSLTGCDDIYLVMGGFHLTGKIFEQYTDQTIDGLLEMKPKMVVPAHCTGFNSTARIARRMPESFVLNSVGTTFRIFG